MQWLALAAEVSDVVVYIAHDNVFTSDVDFLSALLVEHDTAAVTTTGMHTNVSPSLQYVVVALDTQREIDRRDEDALWRPILHIPSKHSLHYSSFLRRGGVLYYHNEHSLICFPFYIHQGSARSIELVCDWSEMQVQ